MPDLFLRHNFATTTTINTRLCVPHSARHTLYTHHPNAWSWQPRIPRYSLGNTRHPDGHKMTKYRKSDHHSSRHFSATTTTINTRLCVPRSTRHTLYTHRPNAWSWQPRISRYSLGNTRHLDGHKIPKMCASRFSPFLCNHDDYQHAALCAALHKAHIIHTSSKCMVMTAKNFEIFTHREKFRLRGIIPLLLLLIISIGPTRNIPLSRKWLIGNLHMDTGYLCDKGIMSPGLIPIINNNIKGIMPRRLIPMFNKAIIVYLIDVPCTRLPTYIT
jgi:hypothetical protein